MFAFYGLNQGTIDYDGYKVLPNSGFDPWGNDVIKAHTERSKSDLVVTLMDVFVLDPEIWKTLSVPWLAWVPIDSEGIGAGTLERLKICAPIAMSNFGVEQMHRYDIEVPARIYHAVDTDVFIPMDKDECRDTFGLPHDKYLVGMVMANKGDRKQYPLQLLAVKQWMDKNPDYDIMVFIHTDPTTQMGGWDMKELVETIGLKNKVFSTNQYDTSVVGWDSEGMAKLYNCFDVLMNCSSGEGFGIPIIEAQACGVPVLVTNFSAMPEILRYGYAVETVTKGLGGHYGWMYQPSLEDMVYRLECAYRLPGGSERAEAHLAMVTEFSVPIIAQQWQEVLSEAEAEIEDIRSHARQVVA